MNPAYRYRRVGAGIVHNLLPPASCQADLSKSRQGTPAQLRVFGDGKALKRCRACEAAEDVAAAVKVVAPIVEELAAEPEA